MMVSDKSIQDAIDAEVIGGTPQTTLIEYDDGSVESVADQSLKGAMVNLEQIDPSEQIHARGRALDVDDADGTGIDVEFQLSTSQQLLGQITVGGHADTVEVTGSNLATILSSIEASCTDDDADVDDGSVGTAGFDRSQGAAISSRRQQQNNDIDQQDMVLSDETATTLYSVYEQRIKDRCRANVLVEFSDSFTAHSGIEITDDGWIVEDTYAVTYDGAKNFLVDEIDTYRVSGGGVTQAEEGKQAVGLSFDTEPLAVAPVDGDEYSLSAIEQKFLATVEFLCNPSTYLEVDDFEREVYDAIKSAKGGDVMTEWIQELTRSVTVSHFVDPESGLIHNHNIDKHVLRSSFQINKWVVDELNYSSFDHAGLAELAFREQEFRNAEQAVFFDGSRNDDGGKWKRINSVEDDAPCPPEVYRRLRAEYGSR
jgi:hypothetical protein